MATLNRQRLRKLIQLEIKTLMDEDALLPPPRLGEPHYADYNKHDYDDYEDEYYPYDDDDDHGCEPCRNKRLGLHEAGDCGCHSKNPYAQEREEDFGYDRNYEIDSAMRTLTNLGGDVNVDFDHDDHRHSSYMARPQLYKIAKYASALLDMVDENEELEDWQESKIAQISQMIGSVYHSLDYDEEYDDHDDLDVHDLIGMIRTGNI